MILYFLLIFFCIMIFQNIIQKLNVDFVYIIFFIHKKIHWNGEHCGRYALRVNIII